MNHLVYLYDILIQFSNLELLTKNPGDTRLPAHNDAKLEG